MILEKWLSRVEQYFSRKYNKLNYSTLQRDEHLYDVFTELGKDLRVVYSTSINGKIFNEIIPLSSTDITITHGLNLSVPNKISVTMRELVSNSTYDCRIKSYTSNSITLDNLLTGRNIIITIITNI